MLGTRTTVGWNYPGFHVSIELPVACIDLIDTREHVEDAGRASARAETASRRWSGVLGSAQGEAAAAGAPRSRNRGRQVSEQLHVDARNIYIAMI